MRRAPRSTRTRQESAEIRPGPISDSTRQTDGRHRSRDRPRETSRCRISRHSTIEHSRWSHTPWAERSLESGGCREARERSRRTRVDESMSSKTGMIGS